MVEAIPKRTLIIVAAVVLFAGFMGVRLMLDISQRTATPVQTYYDELALALESAGLLPEGTADGIIMAAVKVSSPGESFGNTLDTGQGSTWVDLGPVLSLKTRNGLAYELEISARDWKKLTHGRLREALRRLVNLDVGHQRGNSRSGSTGNASPAAVNFHFTSYTGGNTYRFTPRFQGKDCASILVRKE